MLTAHSSSKMMSGVVYMSIYEYTVLVRPLSGKMMSIKHMEEKNKAKKPKKCLLTSSHVYLNQISPSIKKQPVKHNAFFLLTIYLGQQT